MAAPAAGSRESVWPRFRNPLAWLFHGATKSFAEALQSAFQGVIDGQHPEPGAALQQDAVLCPGPPSPPGAPAAGPAVPWHSLQPQHSARNACSGQTGSIGRSSMPREKEEKPKKLQKKGWTPVKRSCPDFRGMEGEHPYIQANAWFGATWKSLLQGTHMPARSLTSLNFDCA